MGSPEHERATKRILLFSPWKSWKEGQETLPFSETGQVALGGRFPWVVAVVAVTVSVVAALL